MILIVEADFWMVRPVMSHLQKQRKAIRKGSNLKDSVSKILWFSRQ
jgi:hypothetical protein